MATLSVSLLTLDNMPDIILSEGDEKEVLATGFSPVEAIRRLIAQSSESYVVKVDDYPIVYGGIKPESIFENAVSVWMLGTPLAERHAFTVVRMAKHNLLTLLERYAIVYVIVHRHYPAGRRWAEWLGFKPYEYNGDWVRYRIGRIS